MRIRDLGEGGFGIVYQARLRGSHTDVAVKELKLSMISLRDQPRYIANFKREIAMMKDLRHPNIVPISNACFEPAHYCIVMEYASGGSLASKFGTTTPPAWSQRWQIALDVGKGVEYLHNHGPILHRDLKSPNVLLDETMRHAKVSDFGLSKQLSDSFSPIGAAIRIRSPQIIGTPQWMAPELSNDEEYTAAADVYSLGIVLWEIASWRLPCEGIKTAIAIVKSVCDGKREAIPADCPPSYASLIRRCWDGRRDARPKITAIVEELEKHQSEVGVASPPLPPPAGRVGSVVTRHASGPAYRGNLASAAPK